MLNEQNRRSSRETELLEHAGQHYRAILPRILGDNQKRELPGEPDTDEAVKKLRMRNCRRIFQAEFLFDEILRRKDDDSVNPGDSKHPASKFHGKATTIFRVVVECTA